MAKAGTMVAELAGRLPSGYDPALLGFALDEHDMARYVEETGGNPATVARRGERYAVWMIRGLAGSPVPVRRWELITMLEKVDELAYGRGWDHGYAEGSEGADDDEEEDDEEAGDLGPQGGVGGDGPGPDGD
jgi:hypothetical protein